jgi:hypothetical protein
MNIAQHIGGGAELNANAHVANAHIGQGIVRALDPNANGSVAAASHDIDVDDIGIRRSAVRTLGDAHTNGGVLKGWDCQEDFFKIDF